MSSSSPIFKGAKPDEVVAVLKAREPARIMIAIGDKAANRWHLQFAERWVVQYNFYSKSSPAPAVNRTRVTRYASTRPSGRALPSSTP